MIRPGYKRVAELVYKDLGVGLSGVLHKICSRDDYDGLLADPECKISLNREAAIARISEIAEYIESTDRQMVGAACILEARGYARGQMTLWP